MKPEGHIPKLIGRLVSATNQLICKFFRTGQKPRLSSRKTSSTLQQAASPRPERLYSEVIRHVSGNIEPPMTAHERQLHEAGWQLQQAVNALERQSRYIESLYKVAVFGIICMGLLSLLILFSSTLFFPRYYVIQAHGTHIPENLLKAYKQADVKLCDGKRLCAKIDPETKSQQGYQPIMPRQP